MANKEEAKRILKESSIKFFLGNKFVMKMHWKIGILKAVNKKDF